MAKTEKQQKKEEEVEIMSDNYIAEIIDLVNEDVRLAVEDLLRRLSHNVLQLMVALKPDLKINIIEGCFFKVDDEYIRTAYASWIKRQVIIPVLLRGINWNEIMGETRNQGDHLVCWAIVATEQIQAVRRIHNRDLEPTLYSPQDLIDFTCPENRAQLKRKDHYCYPLNTRSGLVYASQKGIQREAERPFTGCSRDIPKRTISDLGYIKDCVTTESMDHAFHQLLHQPIGASLAIFQPEYTRDQKAIYRGPTTAGSRLVSFHAGSIVAVGEDENGERYALLRSSQGDGFGHKGCIKVSYDTLILSLNSVPYPTSQFYRRFSKPSSLLFNFVYPRLLSRDEEEKRKEEDKKKINDQGNWLSSLWSTYGRKPKLD